MSIKNFVSLSMASAALLLPMAAIASDGPHFVAPGAEAIFEGVGVVNGNICDVVATVRVGPSGHSSGPHEGHAEKAFVTFENSGPPPCDEFETHAVLRPNGDIKSIELFQLPNRITPVCAATSISGGAVYTTNLSGQITAAASNGVLSVGPCFLATSLTFVSTDTPGSIAIVP